MLLAAMPAMARMEKMGTRVPNRLQGMALIRQVVVACMVFGLKAIAVLAEMAVQAEAAQAQV